MYTASELERASMALDEPMKTLENSIMSDIVRRIRDNGEITAAADWQITRLVQLGMGMAEIQAAITEALGAAEDVTETLFTDVISAGYARDKSLYEAIGKVQIPFEENEPLQQLISSVTAQTNGTMHNITQSLGFAQRGSDGHLSFTPIADYYQRTLDKAMLDISSGAFDYNTVLKRTVKEMTDSGLRTVDYATGWSNRVNVAARRAVMTGMTQLTAQVNEQNAEALETEWFEISWHSGARPSHWWGGKWYTKEQLTTICKLGDVQGLCGANCYHDYSPVIPGISEPTYTDEKLAELNRQEKEPIEYNGKQYTKYEALQRQRRLETTMRAQREEMALLNEGGADEDDLINCRARYHGISQEYTAFSKAMGLPQQRERVFADGLGNIMQGKTEGGSGKESPVSVPPVGAHVTGKVTAEERKELLSRDKVDIADNAKSTKVNESKAIPDTSSRFAPAKTIEEAEKFALENGVRHVDYSDLPLETANLLNEAAMTLPEDIRPAYIGSGKSVQKVTGKKFSRKEKDYYGVHMDVLQMHFGEYPNIEYDFEGGNVVGISTAYKTPEKIHKSKVEGNKAYAEKHDGHTQFFNEDGRSTAFHEMGHIYADKKGIPEGFASDAERWLKESKCDMLKSTDEAWAEAWGAYHTKNPDLPDYIAEYVEKATNTPMSIDYMSNSFRPKYSDSIADISIGDISISTKQVENSEFNLVTDVNEGRRSKAVRLAEKNLKEVQKYLPDNFELPKVAVIDFNEHGLNNSAIGGYHAQSGVMFLNSKFDTTAKVLKYVNEQKGQFANTSEFAPILHELGHKYYEDCVKSLAKEQKIGYNNAKEIIDNKIQAFIHDNIPNEISKVISIYADNGYKKHKYTELVAECFSVRNSNDTADKLISLLKGERTL